MTQYFFHLHECGSVFLDEQGKECADLTDARAAAVDAARDIMSAEVRTGHLCLSCYIDVADTQGTVALHVPFRECLDMTGNRLPQPCG